MATISDSSSGPLLSGVAPVIARDTRILVLVLGAGYDEDRVAAHIRSMPTKPDRTARYFIAHLHNGVRRTVINGKMLENRPYRSIRALVDRVRSEAIADGRQVAKVAT